MSAYWYCCQCGEGGNNPSYVDDCTQCYHTRCSSCTIQIHDTPYAYGMTTNEYSTNQYSLLGLAKHGNPTTKLIHMINGWLGQAETNASTSLSNEVTDSIPHAPEHSMTHNGDILFSSCPSGDVEYYWYCCRCDFGALNLALYVECPRCNDHVRCSGCIVEAIKR
ncbi:unnamed protein product [Periconia digitata]|uniref:Uncharacterized protein n=1 Tax=Periconia digitata TaxID=1303443 RepID=A0A9W4U7F4_9PLEO|nr:unnamed protein product [Periconia digitata]